MRRHRNPYSREPNEHERHAIESLADLGMAAIYEPECITLSDRRWYWPDLLTVSVPQVIECKPHPRIMSTGRTDRTGRVIRSAADESKIEYAAWTQAGIWHPVWKRVVWPRWVQWFGPHLIPMGTGASRPVAYVAVCCEVCGQWASNGPSDALNSAFYSLCLACGLAQFGLTCPRCSTRTDCGCCGADLGPARIPWLPLPWGHPFSGVPWTPAA